MPAPLHQPRALRFGIFEMDLESEELRKKEIKLKFGGQPFHMLAMIALRNGRVVTDEELKLKLWPKTNIDDYKHSLGNFLLKIRQTLEDSAHKPLYIQTVPSGYKFLFPVTILYKVSGQENGSPNHQPGELSLEMDQIQRAFLVTLRCRDLSLLLGRCEMLEKQYPLHSKMPELQVLQNDIRLALERSAALEPNWADHNISFATAARVFQDPNAISLPLADGERRTIGRVYESLLVVDHTGRRGNGHVDAIKAARRATPQERRYYEQSSR